MSLEPDDVAAYDEAWRRWSLAAAAVDRTDRDSELRPGVAAAVCQGGDAGAPVLRDRVVRLAHAGSTAVPGLAAKPIIDMVLEVPDSADEPAYVPALETVGYALRIREPDWFEHRVFKGPDTNVNLHTFSAGCPETDRMLLFRDWTAYCRLVFLPRRPVKVARRPTAADAFISVR